MAFNSETRLVFTGQNLSTNNLGVLVPLFCIEIVILPLFFWLCEFTPTVPFTKHQFAPAPSSTPNGVKLCTKDMNAHAILPLVFMPNCDFALI